MRLQKLIAAVLSNILMAGLPLVGRPSLLLHPRIIALILASTAIWLTQPLIKKEESRAHAAQDRYSVLLIIATTLLSVMISITDFAYLFKGYGPMPAADVAGILLMVTGIVFRAAAVRSLDRFFTPTIQIQDGHRLITRWPYNILRHPSYAGAWLAVLGSAVLLHSLVGVITCLVLMGIAYNTRIRLEENALENHFGNAYREYKRNTKKMIPYIW
jgi:protein-S-isoprenylcysteine O-methyltransferase Ste14